MWIMLLWPQRDREGTSNHGSIQLSQTSKPDEALSNKLKNTTTYNVCVCSGIFAYTHMQKHTSALKLFSLGSLDSYVSVTFLTCTSPQTHEKDGEIIM